MIEVMVGGDSCNYFDTSAIGGGLHFANIIGVYSSRFVGRVVDEKVCIVVVAYRYRYNLHSGSGCGREWGYWSSGWCWVENRERPFGPGNVSGVAGRKHQSATEDVGRRHDQSGL